jgi:hypothetical protein
MKLFLRALAIAALFLPTTIFAQSIVGVWTMSMPAEDGSTVTMQANIKADGTYALDFGADGSAEIVGKYKLDGDQVTVQDMPSGADGCAGVGVYRYTATEKTLTMTRVSDECAGRGGPEGKMVMQRS